MMGTKDPLFPMRPGFLSVIIGIISGILGLPIILTSQNFGGVPPGDTWMIKRNEGINVIYSQDVAPVADTVLSTITRINLGDPLSLSLHRKPINFILRNKNMTTNGFVAYAPFRSELYLFPSQDPNVLGFYDGMKTLTIHEYRHVLQYSALDRGITKLVGDVFGQLAQAGTYNILVPDWFTEGDAVFFESALTGQGRGHLPDFLADHRALLMEGKTYSYNKYSNGSFKDLVPNHYVHGYLLSGYGYRNFPDRFWPDVLDQTSRLKGLLLPFRQAIRRNSGMKLPEYHRAAMTQYRENLYHQLDTTARPDPLLLPPSTRIKDEIQLLTGPEGRNYLLETGYDEISSVYELSEGRKKKLFALGRSFDPYLILRDNRILFTNRGLDSRWTNREFSDVYYFDLDSRQLERVTHQKKYFSVDYSAATRQYLAVQGGETGQTAIVSFQEEGGLVDTLVLEPGTFYGYPRWVGKSGDKFVFTQRQDGQMSIIQYDRATQTKEILIGPVRETIARPVVTSDGIYFSSSRSGIENIYYFDLRTKHRIPVTADLVGAYNPTLDTIAIDQEDSLRLYYSTKTAQGQRIRVKNLPENMVLREKTPDVPELKPWFVGQEDQQMAVSDPAEVVSPVAERYKPSRHLFHFHSLEPEPSLTNPRLSLISNDYLNTTSASLYGRYLNADNSWTVGAEVTYAGWYPEIFLDVNHRFNLDLNLRLDDETYVLPKSETTANAGISIPLDFSRRHYWHFLRWTGQYGWTQEHFDPEDPILPGNLDLEPRLFQTGLTSVNWSLQRVKAYRDLLPKWGITTTLLAKRAFSPAESWLLYAGQNFYIPGFFRNDGFKFRWQLQHGSSMVRNTLSYELRSLQDIPYGDRSFRTGGLFTANYLFPVAYPEVSIPHVIYTKRIAVNLFTEHFRSNILDRTWYGVDVFLTARYFNLIDLTTGIRAYRPWQSTAAPVSWSVVLLQDL